MEAWSSARRRLARRSRSASSATIRALSFPSAKLVSGHYALRVRATEWELEVPVSVEVTLALPSVADLKLRKVRDITPQMTNAEWIESFPGTPDQKKFLYGCRGLPHPGARREIEARRGRLHAGHEAHGDLRQQQPHRAPQVRLVARDPMRDFGPDSDKQAAYLATLNQSSGAWSYALKTLPASKARARASSSPSTICRAGP